MAIAYLVKCTPFCKGQCQYSQDLPLEYSNSEPIVKGSNESDMEYLHCALLKDLYHEVSL